MSLVEHALCPLDPVASLRDHLVHGTTYGYRDRKGHLVMANVRVTCPSGLSAADEFTLWGLLALTFSQQEPSTEFHATPHYCLRQLGLIESNGSKGGRDYQLFRETVRRLSRVIYENTGFYDPIRGEHRDVAFGFLKYSLPIDADSSRTWRFVWDQQFFEFCQATGGGLWFDLDTYRKLDFASRRLFVLLQKIFYRSTVSPTFDVGRLCVDVLGFSPTVDMRNLKVKLARCIDRLATEGVVRLPGEATRPQELFVKQGVGKYRLALTRGPYFEGKRGKPAPLSAEESPLVDPLRSIGFDDAANASRPADPVCQPLGEGVQIVLVQLVVFRHPDNLVLFQVFAVGRDFQLLVERRQRLGDERVRIALRADDDERAVVHFENGNC